jgi:predicted ATPase/DNA-binding winged helix-turn-helix (wHTH) protein
MRLICLGPHHLDLAEGMLHTPAGSSVLQGRQLALLRLLAANLGRPVARDHIEATLWADGVPPASRALDLLLSRVRARVEPACERGTYLQTLRGDGYALVPVPPHRDPARRRGPLVGREREFLHLLSWARADAGRWLTVSGLGGVGKTRLTAAVADTLVAEGQPVGWIDLVAHPEGDGLLFAVATALGLQPTRAIEAERAIRMHRDARILFLDNLEHLPDATRRLGDLLASAPRVRVIATSRLQIGAPWEQSFPLGGIDDDAELVRELVALTIPDLGGRIDDEVVHAICACAGGLPLFMELAVATLRFRPPSELLRALRAGPERLHGEAHGRPDRHVSWSATFTYSWSLATPEAQRHLAALSTFCSSFSHVEAQGAAGVPTEGLQVLLAQSMVQRVSRPQGEGADVSGAPEDLRLHPLVRRFAAARLADLDPSGATARRTRRWFLAWAGSVQRSIRTEDDSALPTLWARRKLDLAASWADACACHDIEGLALAWPGIREWIEADRLLPEGPAWCRTALKALEGLQAAEATELYQDILATEVLFRSGPEAIEAAGLEIEAALSDRPPPETRVRLHIAAMLNAVHRSCHAESEPHLQAALAGAQEIGDPDLLGRIWRARTECYRAQGRSDQGGPEARAAVAAFREADNQPLLRRALLRALICGQLEQNVGDDGALAELLARSERAHDASCVFLARSVQMDWMRLRGESEGALGLGEQLIDFARAKGDEQTLCHLLRLRGILLSDLGRPGEAAMALREVIAHGQRLGQVRGYVGAHVGLAVALVALGQCDEALENLEAARTLAHVHFPDDAYWETVVAGNLALTAWVRHDLPRARREIDHAYALAASMPPVMRMGVGFIHALLLGEEGHHDHAREVAHTSLQIAAGVGEWSLERALMSVALVLALTGDAPLAAAILPRLQAGRSTPERSIYLPILQARLEGIEPVAPFPDALADVHREVQAALAPSGPRTASKTEG